MQTGGLVRILRGWPIGLAFIIFTALTSFPMLASNLTDDQITYWSKALHISGQNPEVRWLGINWTFSYFLNFVSRWTGGPNAAFVALYGLTALLYLFAMYRLLLRWTHDRTASCLTAIVSIVPHYTLGMTYWGFAGFEFVKARMLIMPLVPIVIGLFAYPSRKFDILGAFVLCGFAAVLNLEILYLGLILSIFSILFVLPDPKTPGFDKKLIMSGIFCLVTIVSGIFLFVSYFSDTIGIAAPQSEASIHRHLAEIWKDHLASVSDAMYLSLRWEAARSGLWWAMFPPMWTDLILFAVEHAFLLMVAVFGWSRLGDSDTKARWFMPRFLISVLAVAYGYQIFRCLAGRLWGWPPDNAEEARAFKFAMLPIYLCVAYYFKEKVAGRRLGAIVPVFLILLISPTLIMRAFPESSKIDLIRAGKKILDADKLEYLKKVIDHQDRSKKKDLDEINSVLTVFANEKSGKPSYVLTTEHRIKLSNLPMLLSYQDKKAGPPRLVPGRAGRRDDLLVLWYLTFNEIKGALTSSKPSDWVQAADKYGCRFVVAAAAPIDHPRLRTIYAGNVLSAYEVH